MQKGMARKFKVRMTVSCYNSDWQELKRAITPIANGDTEKRVFSFTAISSINYYSPSESNPVPFLKLKIRKH